MINLYSYTGPVMEFDQVIHSNWHGETLAVSEQKAKNNLVYQFKKQFGKLAYSKIKLVGRLVKED